MNAVARDIERAANAVRSANHSTMRGVLDAPHTYTAVGNLAELADRLPQVLDFLIRCAHRAEPTEHYDDRGADPAVALDLAREHLDGARVFARDVSDQLHAAHNHLGHLGRLVPED